MLTWREISGGRPWVKSALRTTKSEVAQKWAWVVHKPYCLWGRQHLRVGDKIIIGAQVGPVH